jgi:hypothetical protein
VARAGRSYPNRPRLTRHPRNWDWHVTLPVFETLSEWPLIEVVTPSATIPLAAFQTVSEWPTLDLDYDYALALPVFETLSEWPDPGAQVPILPGDRITDDFQIEFNGTLFGGPGNIYQITSDGVEGWDDLPGMDSANVSRPTWHGSWPGRTLAQERQVTATIAVNVADDQDWAGAVATLRRLITPPVGETGQPLVVSTRNEVLVCLEAVADSRAMSTGAYHVGWAPVAVRWIVADPRRYNVQRSGVTIPPGATIEISNAGNVASHPLLRIDGPVVNPSISNTTLGRTLDFLLTLNSGQRLIIDTDAGNATVGGESVLSTLTGSSSPVSDFALERGNNSITFSPDSGGDIGLVALYRDAWL